MKREPAGLDSMGEILKRRDLEKRILYFCIWSNINQELAHKLLMGLTDPKKQQRFCLN